MMRYRYIHRFEGGAICDGSCAVIVNCYFKVGKACVIRKLRALESFF